MHLLMCLTYLPLFHFQQWRRPKATSIVGMERQQICCKHKQIQLNILLSAYISHFVKSLYLAPDAIPLRVSAAPHVHGYIHGCVYVRTHGYIPGCILRGLHADLVGGLRKQHRPQQQQVSNWLTPNSATVLLQARSQKLETRS